MADTSGKRRWWEISGHFRQLDWCLICFSIIGGMLVLLPLLALINITLGQIEDIPYLIEIATQKQVNRLNFAHIRCRAHYSYHPLNSSGHPLPTFLPVPSRVSTR